MKSIATLTLNPTIDVSYDVGKVVPTHKIRCANERHAPGGGGINVARVYARLGGEAECHYLSGGATGPALDGLIAQHGLNAVRTPIAGATRIATAVLEKETGHEYRFTPAGPTIKPAEMERCVEALCQTAAPIIVLSGSLPPGVSPVFYAGLTRTLREHGKQVVLDTSGSPLTHALDAGGLWVVKPSQSELESHVGHPLRDVEAIGKAAMTIVENGSAGIVAVTMGADGAVLAEKDGPLYLPALKIEAASAVGAGDSFVAAMVFALGRGDSTRDAFRLALATGSAAVLRAGTDLAHPADIYRLLGQMA